MGDVLAPGSTVRGVTRLRGGIEASTHRVDLLTPTGAALPVVVRRFDAGLDWWDPARLKTEWEVLESLAGKGLPAPEPLLLDAEGIYLGVPTMVLSCLPGRATSPAGDASWARQLAAALAAVHDLPGDRDPEVWLLDWQQDAPPAGYRAHPLAERIFAALGPWRAVMAASPTTLAHHDFHPGNTLWQRSRLSGVVDWGQAARGWAGYDVGYCRLDIHLQLGPQAARRFSQAYEAETGGLPDHLPAWEAVAALRALPDVEPWLTCYHDLGQPGLSLPLVAARHQAFVGSALRSLT